MGKVTGSPTSGATRKLVLAALLALMVVFALSSIPGAIIGYVVLKALRRTGLLG